MGSWGIWLVAIIFIGIPVAIGLRARLQERSATRRAHQLIQLDRIARAADVGMNQLSIGLVTKAHRAGADSGSLKQYWRVPIQYRANDGGRDSGVIEDLRLDGTEEIRAVEDRLINDILFQRELRQQGY